MNLNKIRVRQFFKFMNERQRIYLAREGGATWPWTKDKILQEWKFTNVYRQQDRVTVELGKRLKVLKYKTNEDIIFHVAMFRIFNWPPTYDALFRAMVDGQVWGEHRANRALLRRKDANKKIFTGAYMMTGSGSDGGHKHETANRTLSLIWRDRKSIADYIRSSMRMSTTTSWFTRYPMISDFVSYEFACDLRHTKVLKGAVDIYEWANPGPGAKRGILRIANENVNPVYECKKITDNEALHAMRTLLKQSVLHLKDYMHILEMRDIEHTLCEFDKYQRVLNDEGRPRSRYHPPEETAKC